MERYFVRDLHLITVLFPFGKTQIRIARDPQQTPGIQIDRVVWISAAGPGLNVVVNHFGTGLVDGRSR